MRLNLIYTPKHISIDWFPLLNAAWTIASPITDSNAIKNEECQFHFSFGKVIPCKMAVALYDDHPIYEINQNSFEPKSESILTLAVERGKNN